MYRLIIEVTEELPAPEGVALPSDMSTADVLAFTASAGVPTRPLAYVEARMPDLEAAHVVISNTAMALAQYGRRVEESKAKDGGFE